MQSHVQNVAIINLVILNFPVSQTQIILIFPLHIFFQSLTLGYLKSLTSRTFFLFPFACELSCESLPLRQSPRFAGSHGLESKADSFLIFAIKRRSKHMRISPTVAQQEQKGTVPCTHVWVCDKPQNNTIMTLEKTKQMVLCILKPLSYPNNGFFNFC